MTRLPWKSLRSRLGGLPEWGALNLHSVCHRVLLPREPWCPHNLPGRGRRALALPSSADSPIISSLADLGLCDFDITGHRHKDKGFAEDFGTKSLASIGLKLTVQPGLFGFVMFLLLVPRSRDDGMHHYTQLYTIQ